jgi:3-oxosteroid 1-dehydrogenase
MRFWPYVRLNPAFVPPLISKYFPYWARGNVDGVSTSVVAIRVGMMIESIQETDVLIVGSGGAGMMAALRAAQLGLDVVIIEKAHQYGGTTATSGGIFWTPCHARDALKDTPERALEYLQQVTAGQARDERLHSFIDNAPRMAEFLLELGLPVQSLVGSQDYFPDTPGNLPGRSLRLAEFDGSELGDEYLRMRAPNALALLFDRYTMNAKESAVLVNRSRGWLWVAIKLMARYWLDIGMRLKSRRDRRATRGDALIGYLRRELLKRKVPLLLNCALNNLIVEDGRAVAISADCNGTRCTIRARKGIVLTAGGFEHNQQRRDAHLPVRTQAKWTVTPEGGNSGDALTAGESIGAATEFLQHMWWQPVIQLPSHRHQNINIVYGLAVDQRHPNSIIVNRYGERFASEGLSYDRFGNEIVKDQLQQGDYAPCWMIFDATFRENYALGGLMPNIVMPDWRIPSNWWDNYVFRSSSLGELASKIGMSGERLDATIKRFNGFCVTGVDEDFGRGGNAYDRAWGDRRVKPNSCLAPINKPPFYAVRVDLGDLGTKGGLKCNGHAQVLDLHDKPIPGLYAAGNSAGSPFANAYPGAGGTIGVALTFGFVAANHIAKVQS